MAKEVELELNLEKPENVQAYQERVFDELNDLVVRYNALVTFIAGEIFSTVPSNERARLTLQSTIMRSYILVLKQRISNFN
jgi:hypothetical protein